MTGPQMVTVRSATNWIVGAFVCGLLIGAVTVLTGVLVGLGTRF